MPRPTTGATDGLAVTALVLGLVALPMFWVAILGIGALVFVGEERCLSLFADYVGISCDESNLLMRPIVPTPETWAAGDREISCLALSGDGQQLAGSVRGSSVTG